MLLSKAISEVRRQLHVGVPFERVEAYIEAQRQLSEEEQAALWLIAWFDGDGPSLCYELGRESVEA